MTDCLFTSSRGEEINPAVRYTFTSDHRIIALFNKNVITFLLRFHFADVKKLLFTFRVGVSSCKNAFRRVSRKKVLRRLTQDFSFRLYGCCTGISNDPGYLLPVFTHHQTTTLLPSVRAMLRQHHNRR